MSLILMLTWNVFVKDFKDLELPKNLGSTEVQFDLCYFFHHCAFWVRCIDKYRNSDTNASRGRQRRDRKEYNFICRCILWNSRLLMTSMLWWEVKWNEDNLYCKDVKCSFCFIKCTIQIMHWSKRLQEKNLPVPRALLFPGFWCLIYCEDC